MAIQLESIRIKNFRSIGEVLLDDLSNTCVFIGKNNAGKSNILRAIKCFFESVKINTATSKDIFTMDDLNNNEDIKIEGIICKDGDYYLVTVKTIFLRNTLYSYHLVRNIYVADNKIPRLSKKDSSTHIDHYNDEIMKNVLSDYLIIDDLSNNILCLENDGSRIFEGNLNISPLESLSYIERNLELQEYSMNVLQQHKFTSQDLYSEMQKAFRARVDELKRRISELTIEIMQLSDELSHIWNEISPEFICIPEKKSVRVPNILTNEIILFQSEKKLPIDSEDVADLYLLKNKREHSSRWKRIRELAQKILGIKLNVFLDEANAPSLDVDKKWINLNGAGIREILRTILDLEMRDVNTALIEEPEVHLHFDLEQKLSNYLLSKGTKTQIFMTTHSTAFIENARNHSVFLVSKDLNDSGDKIITKVEPLSANYFVDAAKEVGLNVSALLIKRLLVYVEGKTDRLIFEHYLSKYHDDVFDMIGFVDMKGESNYEHYATAKSMEVFKDSDLRTFFILDMDNLTETQIQKKKDDHPKDGSVLCFWSAACIETIFLTPEILVKFIRSKTNRQDIELEDVIEKMVKVFEGIKHDAMKKYLREKLLKPLYPNSKAKNEAFKDVEAVKSWFQETKGEMQARANREDDLDTAIAEFETDWNSKKETMVPGDKFLQAFCKEYGSYTYNKDENNIRHLVGSLKKEEWPKEFVEVANRMLVAVYDRADEPSAL